MRGKDARLLVAMLVLATALAGCTRAPAAAVPEAPATPEGPDGLVCATRRCELHAADLPLAGDAPHEGHVWDLGDGTALEGADVAHVYPAPGEYRLVLSARDAHGVIHSRETTVHVLLAAPDEAPVARIRWACRGLECKFDATTSQDVEAPLARHVWAFGDGIEVDHPVVSHVFAEPGPRTVTLTILDAAGASDRAQVQLDLRALAAPGAGTPPRGEEGPAEPPLAPPTPPPRQAAPPSTPAATLPGGASANATAAPETCDAPTPPNATELDFSWRYDGAVWTWTPPLPDDWWDDYATRPRPERPEDFATMAASEKDREMLGAMACIVRGAAQAESFSERETLEFAIRFVQSLRYNDDLAGSGFDEYPKYPIETLVDEEGDCEDTSILLAALLHEMGYDAVLLYFPRTADPNVAHMAVGVAGALDGAYWEHAGRRYHYIETTASYAGIGQLPDAVVGQQALVLPVEARPILGEPWWEAPRAEDGSYRFTIEVANHGTAAVRNLTLWIGWDAGGGRAWTPVTTAGDATLAPFATARIDVTLPAPPAGRETRTWVLAWGANADAVEAFSPSFTA